MKTRMGNNFMLANFDRREYINFEFSKEFELIGNAKQAQLIAYYFWEHNGDSICFIGDQWQVGNVPLWAMGTQESVIEDNGLKDGTQEAIRDFNEFVESWGAPEQKIVANDKTRKK